MRAPFYRKQTQSWYVWIDGKQVRLIQGPKEETKDAALKKWHQLAGEAERPEPGPELTVRQLAGEFLEFSKVENSKRTYEWYRDYCASFVKFVGNLRVRDLKPIHVTRWNHKLVSAGWSDNTRNGAIRAIKRVFNWAEQQELIGRNPVRFVKLPAYVPRDVRITDEEWSTLLAAIKDGDPFKTFLIALRATGARPFEVRTVEARHVAGRAWVFDIKESKGKKRRRSVPLNDTAYAITQGLTAEHPTGPLFRNRNGKPWTAYSINCRLQRLAKKTGVKITAYAVRHEFVSAAIETGKVDLVSLANIVGHADLTMLKQVYSHLEANSPHLQRMVKEATGEVA